MSLAFLRASLDGRLARAQAEAGTTLPESWPDSPDVLAMRVRQLEDDPSLEAWLTRLIVLEAEQCAIGMTGFHGPPGGAWLAELAPGGVELGYSIHRRWRRQGFAQEAVHGLIAWAVRESDARRFVLSISPTNRSSAGLACKLGFEHVGSWEHELRGVENVYRLDVEYLDLAHE